MRSNEELKEASRCLWYEIDMLGGTAKALCKGISDDLKQNAYLESFLLHTRALRDFFDQRDCKVYPDDVIASDFISNWKPPKWNHVSKSVRQKINTMLAHLSYNRLEYLEEAKKKWSYFELATEMKGVIKDFQVKVKKLPEKERREKVDERILNADFDEIFPSQDTSSDPKGFVAQEKPDLQQEANSLMDILPKSLPTIAR